jgi:hypothetical protein
VRGVKKEIKKVSRKEKEKKEGNNFSLYAKHLEKETSKEKKIK